MHNHDVILHLCATHLPEAGRRRRGETTAPLTNHRHTSAHSYFELDPHSRLPTNFAFLVLLSGGVFEKDRLIEQGHFRLEDVPISRAALPRDRDEFISVPKPK